MAKVDPETDGVSLLRLPPCCPRGNVPQIQQREVSCVLMAAGVGIFAASSVERPRLKGNIGVVMGLAAVTVSVAVMILTVVLQVGKQPRLDRIGSVSLGIMVRQVSQQ